MLGSVAASFRPRFGLLADRDFVEVRLGGSGGQGVVLMGIILATAANHDGRCVVETESYGPEARGGYSRSDVIIAEAPIDYPKLDNADLLVALSQDSAQGYVKSLRRNGVLIYDSEIVKNPPAFAGATIGLPFSLWAKEETGRIQATNVVALGAVARITGVVSIQSIREAVSEAVPAGTTEVNLKALDRGLSVDPAEWETDQR
ncbi:MAG: 2-oxoacid:ferredoxin oxidoreductase subunit gamma [Actinobacteria bacterium]|jgi:2-oxoglutarate ferredoxin oxidoreductase subunit gamma|nr:2-oxoacid:ferredoxin oxidoreductase subunit gamma [Actinomycetota bacterium]